MSRLINRPSADIEAFVNHTWRLEDQHASFGEIKALPPRPQSVSISLQQSLNANGVTVDQLKSGVFVEDKHVTTLFLLQAIEFAQRGLCNAAGNYLLAAKGMETWARVTNYYASYFCVHAMLALQGRAISQMDLGGKKSKILVQAVDLQNGIYAVTSRHLGKNSHHETPWRRYYDIYDRYALESRDYEVITRKAHVQDPTDESAQRNLINYSPFQGFQEVIDSGRRAGFVNNFDQHESTISQDNDYQAIRTNLSALSSDPDFRYFARSFLKIIFLYELLNKLTNSGTAVTDYWNDMKKKWLIFLDEIQLETGNPPSLRRAVVHLT